MPARKTPVASTAPVPSASPAPSSSPAPKKPALAAATVDSLTQLQQVKSDLEAVMLKLMAVDRTKLSPDDRATWEDQVDTIDLAIARARSALLKGLSDAFDKELPDIGTATASLAKSLEKLQKVADIIDAVAGVLGVVEKVITLGR
ncbi:MAG: hypothetical protein H7255_00470 [Ramlibacter sp.]|nr:hypothetical protein [Ramlibacter sp.]